MLDTLPVSAQQITPTNPCRAISNVTDPNRLNSRAISNQPALDGDGSTLAFWSTSDLVANRNLDNNIEIFFTTDGGNTNRQVTETFGSILGGFNLAPSISDDGRHIAFYSDRNPTGGNADGNFEIFRASILQNGTIQVTQVTNTQGSANLFPSISGDGRRIAFVSDDEELHNVTPARRNANRNYEIMLAVLGTNRIDFHQITDDENRNDPTAVLGATYDSPSLNFDGTVMAFVGGLGTSQNLFWWSESRPAGDRIIQLTQTGSNSQPSISDDGSNVVFIAANENGTQSRVALSSILFDGDDTTTSFIRPSLGVVYRNPSISGDGSRIAYVIEQGSGASHTVSVETYDRSTRVAAPIPLSESTAGEQPALSSDGTKLAFVGVGSRSDPSDTSSEIFLADCPIADMQISYDPAAIPSTRLAGLDMFYTFTVRNGGPSVAEDARLIYNIGALPALPVNVTYSEDLSDSRCDLTGGIVTCSLGNMQPGSSTNVNIGWNIPSNAGLDVISSEFSVEANAIDPDASNDRTLRLKTTVVEVADLGIVKSASSGTIQAGLNAPFIYTLVITNGGPSNARTTIVTDDLPPNVNFITATVVSGSPGSVCTEVVANDIIRCELGTFAVGSTTVIEVVISARPSAAATLTNLARVESVTDDLNMSNNVSTVQTTVFRPADMVITKRVTPVGNVVAGLPITYTLNVTNAGTANTVAVEVNDVLPLNVTFQSSPDCIAGNVLGTTVVCEVGAMPVGQSRTLTFSALVAANAPGGKINNQASVTSGRVDPNPANNISQIVESTVVSRADLGVSMRVNNPAPTEGNAIAYTVVITNFGPSNAPNVVVEDNRPALLTFVSANTAKGSYNSGTGRWQIPLLVPGESATLTVNFTVNPINLGNVTVMRTVMASSGVADDNRYGGVNSATVTIPINDRPEIGGVPQNLKVNEGEVRPVDGLSVSDTDNNALGMTFSLDSGTLSITTSLGLAGRIAGNGSGSVTILPGTSITDINNTLGTPGAVLVSTIGTTNTTMTITANDGAGGVSDPGIVIVDVNDKPIATVTVPLVNVNEGSSVGIPGISVNDEDDEAIQVVFSVNTGTLFLSDTVASGVTTGDITGNGTRVITVSVTTPITDINTTLAVARGLVYTPDIGGDGVGPTLLEITPSDVAGAVGDTRTVTIDVNDKPITTIGSDTFSVNEAADVAITDVSIDDADDTTLTVQFSVASGAIQLATGDEASGLLLPGDVVGNGTNNITIQAFTPIARINNSLSIARGLIYTPTGIATDVLSITPDDPRGSLGATTLITLTVNEKPVVTVPGAPYFVNEGSTVNLTGISITDADDDTLEVVFAVDDGAALGTISINTSIPDGLLPGDVEDNGSGTVTIRAGTTITRISTTLAASNGIVFTPGVGGDGTGPTTVAITATDDGNAASDPKSVTVTVNDKPNVALSVNEYDINEGVTFTVTNAILSDEDDTEVRLVLTATSGTLLFININGTGLVDGDIESTEGLTLTIRVTTSITRINEALAAGEIRYLPPTGGDGLGPTLIGLTPNDTGGAVGATRLIRLNLNDKPIITVGQEELIVNEGSTVSIPGLSVHDAENNGIRLLFRVDHGTLSLDTTIPGGINAGNGVESLEGGKVISVTGPVALTQITNTLSMGGLRYTPDVSGLDGTLVFTATDFPGGAFDVSDPFVVLFINETPLATVLTDTFSMNEGDLLPIPGVSVIDDDNERLEVVFKADSGHITLRQDHGLGGLIEDNGTSHVTVTVSAIYTDINTTLSAENGLVYSSAVGGDGIGPTVLTVTPRDEHDNTGVTRNITITINDKPRTGVPAGPISVNVGTTLTFGIAESHRITVADADSTEVTVTVMTPVSIWTVPEPGSATVTDNGTNQVSIRGSVADVNAALDGIYYTPGTTGEEMVLVLSVDDGGATGPISMFAIQINSPPNPADHIATLNENVALGTIVYAVDPNDLDGKGGVGDGHEYAIIAGNASGDFAIAPDDNVDGNREIVTAGEIDYESISQYVLTVLVTDTGGLTGTATITVDVQDSNEKPTIHLMKTDFDYAEDSGIQAMVDGAEIEDDSPHFDSGQLTVTLTSSEPGNQEGINRRGRFSFENDAPITLQGSAILTNGIQFATVISTSDMSQDQWVISFTSTDATRETVQQMLRQLAYRNTARNPKGTRTVTFVLNDGGGGNSVSDVESLQISFDPINDPPQVSINEILGVFEDMAASIGSSIVITDPDSDTETVVMTASVASGVLTAADTEGVTISTNGTSSVRMQGTIDDLIALLGTTDGLQYQSDPDFNGDDTLTVTLNDQGHTGSGGAKQVPVSRAFSVTEVNDAPVITLAGADRNADEGGGYEFVQPDHPDFTVVDVDNEDFAGGTLTVTVMTSSSYDELQVVDDGDITTDGSTVFHSGEPLGTFTGQDTYQLKFSLNATATPDLVRDMITALRYRRLRSPNIVEVYVRFRLDDGVDQSEPVTKTIKIDSENDPPDAMDDKITVNEGGTATVLSDPDGANTVLFNDSDPDHNNLSVMTTPVISPTNGTLTLNSDGTFSYEHDGSETTTDSFTYEVCDDETVDPKGEQCSEADVDITIEPVNDPPVLPDRSANDVDESDSVSIVAMVSDPDSHPLTVTITSEPVCIGGGPSPCGTVSVTTVSTHTYIYTPTNWYENYQATFTALVTDGDLTDSATITVNVLASDDAPVIMVPPVPFEVTEGSTHIGSVDATDPEGQTLSYAVAAPGVECQGSDTGDCGTVTLNGADWEYTPANRAADYQAGFTVIVTGTPAGESSTQLYLFDVTAINDAPTLDMNVATVLSAPTVQILSSSLSASDPDHPLPEEITYTITNGPGGGNIQVSGSTVASFTQKDINDGLVTYVSTAIGGPFDDGFTFELVDAGSATSEEYTHLLVVPP